MADWRNPHSGNIAGAQSLNRPMSKSLKGGIAWGVLEVPMNLAAGDDTGTALLKAGASTALWATAPGIMTAHLAATTLPMAGAALYNTHRQKVQGWQKAHYQGSLGGNYIDTQRALTMRQASVQAIESSKMNGRSALGGEAKILSQSWHR